MSSVVTNGGGWRTLESRSKEDARARIGGKNNAPDRASKRVGKKKSAHTQPAGSEPRLGGGPLYQEVGDKAGEQSEGPASIKHHWAR